MGNWALRNFGRELLPETAFIVAGTTPIKYQKEILSLFDNVLFRKDAVSHNFIATYKGKDYAIIFHVYGAPLAIDIIYTLNDGGCKNVIFLGYAYSETLSIGDYFIPTKTYCFDGLTNLLQKNIKYSYPDYNLKERIMLTLKKNDILFKKGHSVSVSSLFHRTKKIRLRVGKINALEMELSSIYYFSKKLKIKSAGLLIISDTKEEHLYNGKKIRSEAMKKMFSLLLSNFT